MKIMKLQRSAQILPICKIKGKEVANLHQAYLEASLKINKKRYLNDPVYEEKARKALDTIWNKRHQGTGLVGTVINTANGDWVRRESGVGAGIDSYSEYLLRA